MNERVVKIERKIKKNLDENRYQHTHGVMYTAASMAMIYGVDVEQAMLAGLLHDCAKCIPSSEKIRLCKKNDIPITDIEMSNPGLLHAKLGAYLAKTKYDILDEEILSSIESHTTGKPNMSMLDKIIYIADYIEPHRRMLPNMIQVRKLAFSDIDLCMYTILKDSLVYLESRNIPLDPMTEQTFYFYQQLINERAEETEEEE